MGGLIAYSSFFQNMTKKMKEKINKYWGDLEKSNMLLVVLLVLDPHYKVKYASFCFTKAYPNDSKKVQKLNALVLR